MSRTRGRFRPRREDAPRGRVSRQRERDMNRHDVAENLAKPISPDRLGAKIGNWLSETVAKRA